MRPSITDKLRSLRRVYPRVMSNGFLFADLSELKDKFDVAVIWFVAKDDEGMHALRSLEFRRVDPADYATWSAELPGRSEIVIPRLLTVLEERHGGSWQLDRIVGWAAGSRAVNAANRIRPKGAARRKA